MVPSPVLYSPLPQASSTTISLLLRKKSLCHFPLMCSKISFPGSMTLRLALLSANLCCFFLTYNSFISAITKLLPPIKIKSPAPALSLALEIESFTSLIICPFNPFLLAISISTSALSARDSKAGLRKLVALKTSIVRLRCTAWRVFSAMGNWMRPCGRY